jgi:hypothetical protein
MEVFQTLWFSRWSRKHGLPHAALCRATNEMQGGLVDADLGSGLYKKRIARYGEGKSGGLRTLVATRFKDRWLFVYGFLKNERDNIDPDELAGLKLFATRILSLDSVDFAYAVQQSRFIKVHCDDEEKIKNP